jgi:hypothetical protein
VLRHWDRLTLFLRQPGAPLDNNVCERALKKAILNRKNALFYRTRNGARVGDLFMSLIYTCQLNRANPFDYLTQLQRHPTTSPPAPISGCPGTTVRRRRERVRCRRTPPPFESGR